MKHFLFLAAVLASVAASAQPQPSAPPITCTFGSDLDPAIVQGADQVPLKFSPVEGLPSAYHSKIALPGKFAGEARILTFPLRDANFNYTNDWWFVIDLLDGATVNGGDAKPKPFARSAGTAGKNEVNLSMTVYLPATSPKGEHYLLRSARVINCKKN